MKRFVLFAIAGMISFGAPTRAAAPDAQLPIAQIRFGGFQQLLAGTNATVLADVWQLPETAELRKQIVTQLAAAAAKRLKERGEAQDDDNAVRWIQPLLSDLYTNEWHLELSSHAGRPVWELAVRLQPDTRALWSTNMAQILSNWELKGENYRLREFSTNTWLLVSVAPEHAGPTPLLQRLRSSGWPADRKAWLTSQVDWPQLRRLAGGLPAWPLDQIALEADPKGNNLRSEARLIFLQAPKWNVERWNVPTNTISDPRQTLISFTAIQSLAPLLAQFPTVTQLQSTLGPGVETPNQLFTWGQFYGPFPVRIQAAAPIGNVTNAIQNFIEHWVPRLAKQIDKEALGQLRVFTNRVAWAGLPALVPHIMPAADPGFVLAGILPLPHSTNPPPAALIQQLTERTNLLYYDWEITQARLAQLRSLTSLLSMFVTVPPLGTNAPAGRWLDAIGPKLGNTATEASLHSPTELMVIRTAPLGLTGLELLALAYWINGTNFPELDFDLRFRLPQPAAP